MRLFFGGELGHSRDVLMETVSESISRIFFGTKFRSQPFQLTGTLQQENTVLSSLHVSVSPVTVGFFATPISPEIRDYIYTYIVYTDLNLISTVQCTCA